MEEAKKKFSLKETTTKVINYTKEHWNTPPKGRYLNIKEWVSYCLGGAGAITAAALPNNLALIAGLQIAVALNINVWHITIIGIINTIITMVLAPFRAAIIDNVRSKRFGRFRVYLAYLALPLVLLTTLTAWVPAMIAFNNPLTNPDLTYMLVLVSYTVLYNILSLVTYLYSTGFNMMQQVISPSPEERTNIMSFGTMAYSLGPSIVNLLYPLLANLLFSYGGSSANGANNIKTYLYLIPIFTAITAALALFVVFGTEERIVLPKAQKQKVKMKDGLKMSVKNKYLWINVISNFLGAFRLAATGYMAFACTYMIDSAVAMSIAITVIGLAYNPAFILSPFIIKKIGKKNMMIASMLLSAIATIPLIFVGFMATDSNKRIFGLLILVVHFIVQLSQAFAMVATSSMTSQLYDFQQYKTGQRAEGWLSQFQATLGTLLGLTFSAVGPAIFTRYGYTSDASVLYNVEESLGPIIGVNAILGVASGILAAIPYFFWDIDEKRHQQIMDVLKVRANYADGLCDQETAQNLEERIEAGETNVLSFFDKNTDNDLVLEGAAVADATLEAISPIPVEVDDENSQIKE